MAGVVRSPLMPLPFEVPPAASRPFDVVGVGQNSIDYLAVTPTPPAANSKQRLDRFVILPGGQVATAMVACSRLGWRCRYIGAFGGDEAGRVSRQSLEAEGVDVTAARTIAGAANRTAVIVVDARSGERTVLWHADAALRIGDVAREAATSGRLLIVDADDIGASASAAAAARAARIPTIVDIDALQPGVDVLLNQIDAMIVAEPFPVALTGFADLGRALDAMAREYRAPLVCVTLGREGSLARVDGREIRTPAIDVDCVDTTGAGDVFRAGFAAACLRWPDGPLDRALAYANAAAGLSCRGFGARGALPATAEIDRVLRF
jgi:sulfofructose kinase